MLLMISPVLQARYSGKDVTFRAHAIADGTGSNGGKAYYDLQQTGRFLAALTGYDSILNEKKLPDLENQLKLERLARNQVLGISAVLLIMLLGFHAIFQVRAKNNYREQSKQISRQHKIILDQNRKLEEYQTRLEQKVEERTTELSEALQMTQESSRLKSVFIHTISHEIRTPMNAIVGFSQVIREQSSRKEIERSLDFIVQSCYDLLNTVTKVLGIAREETENRQLELAVFSSGELNMRLSAYLYQLIYLYNPIEEVRFDLELQSFGGQITTDIEKLQRILGYLLENAFKFTTNGSVVLESRDHGHELEFRVSDTGPGIEKEKLKTIFEMFRKGDEQSRGTGLGLTIVEMLVQSLKGSIQVDSELNRGTVFSVKLPKNGLSIELH